MYGGEDNGVNTYAPPSTNSLGPYLLGLRATLYNAFPDFDIINFLGEVTVLSIIAVLRGAAGDDGTNVGGTTLVPSKLE